jgi:membrane protein required for colicin V production
MSGMNWADIAILTIIGLSALISLFRGFVREVLSLVAWVVAFWIAFTFTNRTSGLLIDYVSIPTARYVIAFIALLVFSLLLTGVVNHLIGKLIDKTGLSGTDRMLGVLFGLVRGVAVVGVIVFLAGLTPVPRDPWWRESTLMGHFQDLALVAISFLPPDLVKHFNYS